MYNIIQNKKEAIMHKTCSCLYNKWITYEKKHTTGRVLSAFEVGPSLLDLIVPSFVSFIIGKDLKGDLNIVMNR